MTAEDQSDTELVSRSLAGDHDAYSRIVSRYQTLICSLAYVGWLKLLWPIPLFRWWRMAKGAKWQSGVSDARLTHVRSAFKAALHKMHGPEHVGEGVLEY